MLYRYRIFISTMFIITCLVVAEVTLVIVLAIWHGSYDVLIMLPNVVHLRSDSTSTQ